MPEVFRRIKRNWFAVKEELENLEADYISINEFRERCALHNIKKPESQDTLLSYLHELGIVLNFEKEKTKVLNPEWVTRGVYKLITSVNIRNNKAVLTPDIMQSEMESLNEELRKEGKSNLTYHPDNYQYIIKLMMEFELCYEIQGTKDYYIPGRLEEDKPADIGDWDEKECLGFRYDYGEGILHESVMSRFIVKMHRKIYDGKQWLTGVVLDNDKGNMALVRADITKGVVNILIKGNQATRREFLAIIRSDFEDIHTDIKVNKPKELVPLSEHPESFIEYEKLLLLEKADAPENLEIVGGELRKINAYKLLNGITTAERRKTDLAKLQKNREEENNYRATFLNEIAKFGNAGITVVFYTSDRQLKSVEADKSQDIETNLKKLEGQIELLDKQADSVGSKKAFLVIIFSIIIHLSSFAALIYFIFFYPEGGWEKNEKFTFAVFAGLEIINALGCLLFFMKTRKDFSWSAFCEWMIDRQKKISYSRNDSIDKRIENLKSELNEQENR